jgi:Protein of unknown function (DUF2905)
LVSAKSLIIVGILFVLVGLLWTFAPQALSWFGRLPGDIRVEGERNSVVVPLTSMLLISIALSLLSNLLFRK